MTWRFETGAAAGSALQGLLLKAGSAAATPGLETPMGLSPLLASQQLLSLPASSAPVVITDRAPAWLGWLLVGWMGWEAYKVVVAS
jgi:hypothetical protein